jgi:hypothetical protein
MTRLTKKVDRKGRIITLLLEIKLKVPSFRGSSLPEEYLE